ncbi:MAG: tyrosine-type recombinase/integrase, partial [Desulfosoma sp.]|uniref:tyrosine-type recombinase/integrase n=1 Tax=Desulfosoma sp. TaxID=2603217 RepID=UPI004049FD4E
KIKDLEIFRRVNDIVSLQREENQLVARLRGLNDSLTRARERLTHARARLQSLEEARARGEDLLEGRELQLVTALEQKAENLRDQLHDLAQRYTERYMALDPKIRNLRSQLERTEEKIRVTKVQAQAAVVNAARQEVVGAQRALEDLEEQVKQYKSKIQDFNEKFARHEALVEEVKSLEALVRARAQNRMHKDVAPEETVPRLSLLESPSVSERPVRPHYLRDMGIVAAGAVLLSLMGVWLVEFLQRSPEKKPPAQSTTLIFQPNVLPGPESGHKPLPAPSHAADPRPVWRELSPLEIQAMAQKAAPQDALILGLLLSGVREDELESLRWEHVDMQRGLLTVPGTFTRTLLLPGMCLRALDSMMKTDQAEALEGSSQDQSRQAHLLVDAHGTQLGMGEMRKRLTFLAQEAGLAAPADVTPELLRYTFLMFLVRQGIRLGALESVAGKIPDAMYAHYGAYAPPGPGKEPQAISRIMPVLD